MFLDPATTYPRSAPAAWGAWPAEPARFDAVAHRALAAIAQVVRHRQYPAEIEIEVWMHAPADFAATYFDSCSESVTIGSVLIRSVGRAWSVVWNPATDEGVLMEYRAVLPHEIARATYDQTHFT